MDYLHFRGGPADGWSPAEPLEGDMKCVWLENTGSGEAVCYRRTDEHVYINGIRRVIFEYDPK
ncbi:hypothetical protein AB0C13_22245 [Streptomyces sp. NPDC049099]|uniref:hypothetical protein n=1 Tax=Streptomyces sp. NPDC049099 TaxID=3155768 RepID=UPI003438FF0E